MRLRVERLAGSHVAADIRKSDLPAVVAEAAGIAAETKRVFGGLSAAQINWKPSADEWSIGQCFDHLVISNRPYEDIFSELVARRRRPRLRERVPLLPRLFARLLITTLRPGSGRKVKARPAFYPSSSDIAPAIVAAFLQQQERLMRLMQALRGLDLDRIIITSPVLSLATYSALDACRIIVVHEQNHVVQASDVMQSHGFPR